MNTLKSAYYAGLRAGKTSPLLLPWSNGLKILSTPGNPFTRWQFVRSFLWECGRYEGTIKRLTAPRF